MLLNSELNRYKKIDDFIKKKENATKENDIIYYEQYIDMLLHPNETIDNFYTLYKEFEDAYDLRKKILSDLYKEIKIIQKLKV